MAQHDAQPAPPADQPPPKRSRLSRLRGAFAGRDWVGVAIEIGIVTVGVLLAFEIEQWGQRRERAEQERQFMEELYADTRSGITELVGLLHAHDKVLRDVPVALQARDDPAKIAAIPRGPGYGCGLTRPLLAPYNDTAYEELIQSGRLRLLSDAKLRTAVRDLAASQKWGEMQGDFTRELVNVNMQPVTPYYGLTLGREATPACHIDWPGLLRDDAAFYATTRLVRRHRQMWDVRKRTLALTERVQTLLACELGRPGCRAGKGVQPDR